QRFPYALYLISGLRSSGDVMRGEETELLGLHAALHITDGLFLMAGTHSKHIVVENNAVIGFKTYMTGEFFDLSSSKSLLSNSVTMDRDAVPDRNFEKGVEEAQKENLLHSLFSIRARELILSSPDKSNNYAFLSGIVIGTELRDIGTTRP